MGKQWSFIFLYVYFFTHTHNKRFKVCLKADHLYHCAPNLRPFLHAVCRLFVVITALSICFACRSMRPCGALKEKKQALWFMRERGRKQAIFEWH